MYVISAKLTIQIPWASSLKDKRQIKRSLTDKIRQKFNISIAEVATQDILQTLTLGIATVSGEYSHAQEVIDKAIQYIESITDAEIYVDDLKRVD